MTDSAGPRIYTKTGDTGETSLFDGTRVSKADGRIDASGHVDELGACLGLARAHLAGGETDLVDLLERVQRDLFAVGAQLADPRRRISTRVTKASADELQPDHLEQAIDRLEAALPPLRRFILPGGTPAGAALHLARTVCRRAERHVVSLAGGAGDAIVITYLNRLSDLLFVMARTVNDRAGVPETEW